jgi:hypothetical protein
MVEIKTPSRRVGVKMPAQRHKRFFFITFFLYRHHRHPAATLREFSESAVIKECARLQRRFHRLPNTIFNAL